MPTDRDRRPPGTRWWWLVVAALALVVVALLVRGGGEDDAATPATVTDTPSLEPADAGSEAERGSVTAGGEDLLEGGDGDLSRHVGEEVVGNGVSVASAVGERTYWVGDDAGGVLLVVPEGADPGLAEGDAISFRGTMRRLEDEVRATASGPERSRLDRQGAYVEVEELERVRGGG